MKFLSNSFSKGGLLAAIALLLCNIAFAQRTVKGKVTDAENGDGLIGASVSVVGTPRGTVSDIDGNYSVEVPAGTTQIRFSYTGYAEQTLTLGASNVLDVALATSAALQEVVVVGYGTVRKSDLTGSVSSVGEKDFNKGLVTSADQLIQGKAAGVMMINNSGQPGGASTIRIRGNSSIRAGNEPLFVVDGVQLTGASSKPGANIGDLGASPNSNPLNYLNPADIESIQILKDASATAIYGARGANGVIMITTKKGKNGNPSVDFNSYVGMSTILKKYDVLSAGEYRSALTKYGLTKGDYGADVDAMDEILQTGITQNYNASISGGSDNGNYRFGLNYMDQEGIVKSNDLKRITANFSGSYKFFESKRFMVDYNLIASHTDENGPSIGTNSGFQGSLISAALQWNPTHKMYNSDGTPVIVPDFGNTSINPVALIDAYHDNTNTIDLIGSIAPSFKITDKLTYRLNYALTQGLGDRNVYIENWINIAGIEKSSVSPGGLAGIQDKKITNQILSHTLNYISDLGAGINLNALVGYEYQKRTDRGTSQLARGFSATGIPYTDIMSHSIPGSRQFGGYHNPDAELQSFFVRGIFNIRERFLVTATMRADGSSKFGENNKYGYFPAVGAAWNLHNEGFLNNGPFSSLKLRAGWGKTGNSEFPSGSAVDRYTVTNVGGNAVIRLENVGNPDLKWETTTTINVGVDWSVMNGKINGTIDYFNRSTEDLLFRPKVIVPAPLGEFWVNLPGNVVNKGVEFSLNALAVDRENFSWNVGGNVTLMENILENYDGFNIEYGEVFGQGATGAFSQKLGDGQPLNAFYLREHLSVGADGQSTFANNEKQAFVGDPNPNVLLGISTSLSAGKWSFGMNFNGTMGHQIFNNTRMTVTPIGNLGTRNIDATLLEGSVMEAQSNSIKASTRYLENGNYLKLANSTLSYNFGDLGRGVKNARVYLTGQNLLVFTNFTGFDPEVNTVNIDSDDALPSSGIEYAPYPSARTILVGANFSF